MSFTYFYAFFFLQKSEIFFLFQIFSDLFFLILFLFNITSSFS